MSDTELPYAGTTGWSGSDTSRERAEREADDGTATRRQALTIRALHFVGPMGNTYQDLCREFGWHHGQASAVLTVLHKAGRIERLTERRNRCAVYVLPQFVGDRETAPYRPNSQREPAATITIARRSGWSFIECSCGGMRERTIEESRAVGLHIIDQHAGQQVRVVKEGDR